MSNPYHTIIFFTDGATRGNPGPGGYGVVLIDTTTGHVWEYGEHNHKTTNNEMELNAIVRALQVAKEKSIHSFTLFTDSKYAHSGITAWRHGWARNGWKTKDGEPIKNRELWQQLHELLSTTGFVDIQWIRVSGHMGIPGNEQADKVATDFADMKKTKLAAGAIDEELYRQLTNIPSPEEIEKIRQRKRAHTSGEGCWYLSLVDGKLEEHQAWDECKERTQGKSAKFKKVCSQEEKEEIVEQWKAQGW